MLDIDVSGLTTYVRAVIAMVIKRLIFIIVLLLGLCACTSNSIESKISKRINGTCTGQGDCEININTVTDFQWDKMFVFKYSAGHDEIERALGVPFTNYVEFKRRIVFINKGKIVYREDEPTDIEAPVDGQVFFDIPDNQVYKFYTPDTAVFRVQKKNYYNKVYYELKQYKSSADGL